jgi:hypothetical protein
LLAIAPVNLKIQGGLVKNAKAFDAEAFAF